MHANAVSLVLDDHKKAFKEKLAENLEQNSFLIQKNEKYTTDKFTETFKYMQEIDRKVNGMATITQIE